jgi:RNA polymerase sigma-70 factor (ECF subfamily)
MINGDFSEKELIKCAAGGDREAFSVLSRAAAPAVYSLAYRLTGNKADADDLAQEALVNAWRHLGSFESQCSFGSWVYRITVNLWKNKVKYEKRRFFYRHVSLYAPRRYAG